MNDQTISFRFKESEIEYYVEKLDNILSRISEKIRLKSHTYNLNYASISISSQYKRNSNRFELSEYDINIDLFDKYKLIKCYSKGYILPDKIGCHNLVYDYTFGVYIPYFKEIIYTSREIINKLYLKEPKEVINDSKTFLMYIYADIYFNNLPYKYPILKIEPYEKRTNILFGNGKSLMDISILYWIPKILNDFDFLLDFLGWSYQETLYKSLKSIK